MSGREHHQTKRRLGFQDTLKAHTTTDAASNEVILRAKQDAAHFFRTQPPLVGADGIPRHHFVGDHFSRNADLIDRTELFSIAHLMPKGAHLHIHFNSTLLPEVLLGYAKEMKNMYIWADLPLVSDENLAECKVEFGLRHFKTLWGEEEYREKEESEGFHDPDSEEVSIRFHDKHGHNLFDPSYQAGKVMRYQYFREQWDIRSPLSHQINCDDWLMSKLVFSKEEADAIYQEVKYSEEHIDVVDPTALGWSENIQEKYAKSQYLSVRKRAAKAWDKFNGRTKMMKGLFNYEKAFRAYTRKCLEEFVRDNVQYAEIRPNFMPSNQLFQDDGQKSNIDNRRTMEIIIDEYERFMIDIGDMTEDRKIKENRKLQADGTAFIHTTTGLPLGNGERRSFGGLKVIYCTPRSFSKVQVRDALNQCIEFKKEWPQYIAGFDLVGEEAYEKKHPLNFFKEEFNNFRQDCKREGIDIPFLFHCGETPDDIEDNLDVALELDARRIGHGYALPHKPRVMNKMKENGVCVEVCPISNMILGLAETMSAHNLYKLLHNNVHCAVSSDNGTLFRSTLSHDFFEVMVGHEEMNIYGWEQLARWSIEHASLDQDERERILVEWQLRWNEFTAAIKKNHGSDKSGPETPLRMLRLDEAQKKQQ